MRIKELLDYVAPGNWIYVNDGHRQIFYGLPDGVPERVKDLEIAAVGCDAEFRGTIDVYIRVM